MSFEIVHAPGVRTRWLVSRTDLGDEGAKHLCDSLLEVEELIEEELRASAADVVKVVYTLGGRVFHLQDGTVVAFDWQPLVLDWRCLDCGVDTDAIDEYYMVHDSLWRQAVSNDGHLCIGCLETRLGRGLTGDDFTDANVNSSVTLARSERLRDRLGRR